MPAPEGGQSWLIPTEILGGTQADFEALGFIFRADVPFESNGSLLRLVRFPVGWTRKAFDRDEHWWLVCDEWGRERASIYEKHPGDGREAFVNFHDVRGYVFACQRDGLAVVPDEQWATPAAISSAAYELAIEALSAAATRQSLSERLGRAPGDESVVEAKERCEAFRAIWQRFSDGSDSAVAGDG